MNLNQIRNFLFSERRSSLISKHFNLIFVNARVSDTYYQLVVWFWFCQSTARQMALQLAVFQVFIQCTIYFQVCLVVDETFYYPASTGLME